ncbi:MAG TPA: hypothetical protein VF017_07365 [Thermoanaerobaculia bacterium]|nr:hypothetical protein [Thermoanaerobaculia bacterium]
MQIQRFFRIEAHWPGLEKPKSGTGYLVRADRILTAAHVVEGATSILLHSHDGSGEPRPAELAWHRGERKLDVGVLRVEADPLFRGAVSRLADGPREAAPWQSRGFPRIGAGSARLAWLHGDAAPSEDTAPWFEIDAKLTPEDQQDWRGVSGAPVFVGDVVVGVIGQVAAGWKGGKLLVAPLSPLLGDSAFREALCLPELDQPASRLRTAVEASLRGSPAAAAALAAAPDRAGATPWLTAFQEGGTDGLGRVLLSEAHLIDVVWALDRALESLGALLEQLIAAVKPVGDTLRAITALEEVTLHIVPLLFRGGLVQELSRGEGAILRLPVYTKTFAEITLAALAGRPLNLLPPTNVKDAPQPALGLAEPPNDSLDVLGFGAFGIFVYAAACDLLSADDRLYLHDASRTPQRKLEVASTRLRKFFADEARDPRDPRRYYLLLKERSEEKDPDFVGQLRKELSLLQLVKPEGDDLVGEADLCDLLARLLFRVHRLKREHR